MMIRRVKWLEFAGKGKDLAGMTADTANTPHRGISATSASPPHHGIPTLRSGVPARLRRGDAKQTKGSLAGLPSLTGDSVALLRRPRPPAAGFAESHQKIQLK